MATEILNWVFERGGWGGITALLFGVAAYIKDKQLNALHLERKRESRQTALLLHGLLAKYGKTKPVTIPDDETTGVIDVARELRNHAQSELDPGIEELVKAYLRNGNGHR